MDSACRMIQQGIFLPKPPLTEENLPDQAGRVHIVTGGYAGVGHELVKILYAKNATVYSAGRSKAKATKSINAIRAAHPDSTGELHFLLVDLSDLSTIKPAIDEFISKETRLDVLTNNAGVMVPPVGSKDAQGYELQLGTNCLGPFLFTSLLLPLLKMTAATSPMGGTRVTWASSSAIEISAKGGVQFEQDSSVRIHGTPERDYAQSKVGNVFLAAEGARRYGNDGIISVAYNPGNLQSDLQRHVGHIAKSFVKLINHPPVFGSYTELYAGWSDDITQEYNGSYVIPWGRLGEMRADLTMGIKSEDEGGSGAAAKFWDWCVKVTERYA